MSAISASLVKDLRDKTGAGMADCKKALEESQGDMEGAIEWLRKRGAASIAKRADREANEGIVVALTSADGKTAAIVELNCETDFVARNEEFVAFANTIAQSLLANDVADEDALWALPTEGGKTLGNYKDEILAKFSEKIGLRRFERIITNGHIVDYVHAGSRLGVLVEFEGAGVTETARPMARDIALQVAAMQPQFVDRSQVDQTTLAKELEIYRQAAIQEGKKEDIAERIAQGRLGKFYEETVLIEQTFVKDPSRKVSDVLSDIGKAAGGDVKVVSFRRFNIGEKAN
ncbi:MAG: translation elongation factor Ts [Candidatus Kapabacteria bacterium]|jgi:elongation factor Ts|nr:translation elongation factor Ts [Candidatus Kapabacteria bacterium]